MGAEKVRADRLRRKLGRMGYRLTKSTARDPDDITYGGYMIVQLDRNIVVAGRSGSARRGYTLDLDEVEVWVRLRSHIERSRAAMPLQSDGA